jgi:hypothetical protein
MRFDQMVPDCPSNWEGTAHEWLQTAFSGPKSAIILIGAGRGLIAMWLGEIA